MPIGPLTGKKSQSTEQQDRKLQALRDALAEGEFSGPAEPFDLDAFLADGRANRSA